MFMGAYLLLPEISFRISFRMHFCLHHLGSVRNMHIYEYDSMLMILYIIIIL